MKTYYMVGIVEKTITLRIDKEEIKNLDLNWAEGMIGACPLFETQEEAETYSNGKGTIYKLEGKE